MKRVHGAVACAIVAVLAPTCTSLGPSAGGSGTETTTGITVCAVYHDRTPAAGATVRLRASDYFSSSSRPASAGTSIDTVTDGQGYLTISDIDSGAYLIEINDQVACAAAVRCSVRVADGPTNLGERVLKPYSTLAGTIDTAGTGGEPLFAAVRGMERLAEIEADGSFSFGHLPEGMFAVLIAGADTVEVVGEFENVNVISGAVSSIRIPSGWSHSRLVYLNTTSSGANVAGDVYNFPLLIRLNETNFDFSMVKDSGHDIGFAKTDGTPLPVEIEHFSKTDKAAAIWVRADTVYGNDSTQALVMSWGNPAALVPSDGPVIFDTANGFLGVWHMSDKGDAIALDATSHGRGGTNYGAADTLGIIGRCRAFDGNDSVMVDGLLGSPRTVTVSVWVQTSAADPGGYEIVSIGGHIVVRMDIDQQFWANGMYHAADDSVHVRWLILDAPLQEGSQWHYLIYSIDSVGQQHWISVDGAAPTVGGATDSINYSGLRANTSIGAYAIGNNQHNFVGNIDEVRVSSVARSADWTALCYMNQKPVDALVKIR